MARQSEWQRKATRQEIEIVSRLKHPYIMPYKEHWTHHGHTINVVYGYCEKGDLTTAISKQKGKLFSEDTLRLWLAQLLLAVEYMHRANVLHRDIKTQNILMTGDGDVQIGDFGLSTVRVPSSDAAHAQHAHPLAGGDDTDPRRDASPQPHRHADGSHGGAHVATTLENARHGNHGQPHAGLDADKDKDRDKDQLGAQTPVHDPKAGTRNDYALVGTPHFMSPELLSSQKYSFETDMWSLGVVMYELTTLKPPFNAFNLAGLVAKIKRAALPPIPSGYSADWAALLKR
ncbi:hypothetical protein GPECTOR_16g637 [Gonium pectorale]|uniref:non-specific serine/threonine protein kinase n=1 Tax=Gonium pectorale TaxID=33097 RepID=A0A150GKW4_GONPE|nr:hypothetical protein GPECTOR_16g637 [Gonium pectorale]|eukprot:KXZ50463.1 hypothetical protein GPECTOR_16g637 [Gonium pectorale]